MWAGNDRRNDVSGSSLKHKDSRNTVWNGILGPYDFAC